MKIRRCTASDHAREHMAEKHNVEWDEVEEVMAGGPRVLKGRNTRRERRYRAIGRTHAGRRLTVIFRVDGHTAGVITAYEED